MTLNALPPERHKPYVLDILELFAGEAKAKKMAKSFGVNALELFDKNDGKDLQDPKTKKLVEHAIQRFRPYLLLAGFPCALYSIMNENGFSRNFVLSRGLSWSGLASNVKLR